MKRKLYLDFDQTICNSIKSFCSVYSDIYKYHKDFKQPNWRKVNKWNFSDEAPLVENVEDIFADKRFFNRLEFIDENMKEVLYELNKIFDITIVSIGTYKNISLKSLWIAKHLDFIQNSIFIVNKGCKMDKSIIKMNKDDIIVDDHQNNLFTSSAGTKICFADCGIKEWNEKWDGLRVQNSLELFNLISDRSRPLL